MYIQPDIDVIIQIYLHPNLLVRIIFSSVSLLVITYYDGI